MSSENEDQVLRKPPDEYKLESQKKSKISYTRDFLLSLSELDICKKLPGGFDVSLLSEFEDASNITFERQRSLGGLSLQSSKCNEHGSLSQNRLESLSCYSRGNQGRWDTRSSGSSDKDGDSQSDRESFMQDSGRRFGNQTRRYWQHPEHDGLLGSGAFPRPSGYAGVSAPKAWGNGQYQLNRTTEPYQPPRPYKALPYTRKDGTDSYNDETFGSAECSSDDRAEEERKRRASFELMRKEQQKALQEKPKKNPDSHNENLDPDIIALLDNSADAKCMRSRNKSDDSVAASLTYNDSSRSSSHMQAPASRPLVPPGFASTLMEKNLSVQSSSNSLAPEAGSVLVEDNHSLNCIKNDQDERNHSAAFVHVNMQKNESKGTSVSFVDANEKLAVPTSSVEVLKQTVGFENMSSKTFGLQEANEVWEDDVVNDFSRKKEARSEIMNTVSKDHSTTILEKLFSSALSKNFGSSPKSVEHQGVIADEETWSLAVSESSKFARWFSEEEKKPAEDFSSRNLLSLIVSNEKVGSHVSTSSEDRDIEHIPPRLPFENIDTTSKLFTSPATSSVLGIPEHYSQGDKKSPNSVVLTCEDLEQSILAEVKDSSSSVQHSVQRAWTPFDGKSEKRKADVDDRASQHLLSLLQKGVSLKESISFPRLDVYESSDRPATSDVKASISLQVSDNAAVRNSETVNSSQQNLTLETLFGASFMNALHSAEAPVSAQGGSFGTVNNTEVMQPHRLPFPRADDGFFSSTSNESRSNKTIHDGEMLALNDTQKAHTVTSPWVGSYGDSTIEDSKLGDMVIEEGGAVEIHLPEEDSLITVGDTLNPITSDPFPFDNANKPEEFLPEKTVEDLNDKLLNAIFRDGERLRMRIPDGPPVLHNSLSEMVDPDNLYHHLHGRPSSQFPHQINQARPLFPPLDHLAHRTAQVKFTGPDGMHHDPRYPFPGNVIPHHSSSSVGAPRFDPAAAHHLLFRHMPVPRNFPSHHPIQGMPGVPLSHPINHMPGYIPEMNNIHNFPLHHRQPNYGGGLGIGMPGSVVGVGGGTHPEALERLIEMEMRANSKQIHPAVGGHIPGIYGPELDINFRY